MPKKVTDKCPYCGKKGEDVGYVVIRRARDATLLFSCENEHLWGRYT